MSEDVKKLIESSAAENRQLFGETRRHFDVVAERMETKVEAIAEGLNHRMERLEQRFDHLESEIANEFNDTRSMIKFSHHELDRRVRTLEESVADLQTRVGRLESSTH